MKYLHREESIPVAGRFQVIVAGGGVAGIAAALAARRAGKSVLLLEKATLPGGLATLGLVNFFVPMCNGRGRKIAGGMVDEFVALAVRYGYDSVPADWKDGEPAQSGGARYSTLFSPQIFAVALTDRLAAEGVTLKFDTLITSPVMDGCRCDGLIVENKSGRSFYEAEMVIDATGDADVLRRSGVPTVTGGNYFTYGGLEVTLDSCRQAVECGDIGKIYRWRLAGNATLYGDNHPASMKLFDGTDAGDVSEYLVRAQRLMLEKLKPDDRRSRDLATLPTMPQFRTTCRIDGDFTLRETDHYRHFEDSVAAVSDFDRRDFLYEIPYRTMVRNGYDNLIAAGRCVSGEGYAWDVLRVIPAAIATGQAAGTAAALALELGCPLPGLACSVLQPALVQNGVRLHFDDALIPETPRTAEKTERNEPI